MFKAGSLQVRVRRDADEQLVLAHVVDRLSNLVSVLTVQVFKDDWAMRKAGTVPHASTHIPLLNSTSSASILPICNASSLVHNGNIIPHYSVASFSQTPLNSFPAGNPKTVIRMQTVNPVVNAIQSQKNYWRQPLADSHHIPVTSKNLFLPDFSTPSVEQKQTQQIYANNLLISGTRTLDANQFAYHPR